jgi:RING finger protein 113A
VVDGISRLGDPKQHNKFLAVPIKASQNICVTTRFDYQPDICKDYKDTGFCGFGDTCIYLHDRRDTLSGWQIEQQWEEEQRQKKEKQEKELAIFMDGFSKQAGGTTETITTDSDGLPFACFICRQPFVDPVVTNCQHYFCQGCIMDHVQTSRTTVSKDHPCPICHKDTHNVFHKATKLLAKKKRVLGLAQSNLTILGNSLTMPCPTATKENHDV